MTDLPPNLTPAQAASPHPKTPAVSVWSLVLGILSIFCLWLLGSIPAIILGIIGMKKANENPQEFGGKGLALAGIITGGVGILSGLVTVGIYAGMMVPALSRVQVQAQEVRTMSNMRLVSLAIQAYNLDNDFEYPESLDQLFPDYLDSEETLMQEDSESGTSAKFLYRPAEDENNLGDTAILLSPFPHGGERLVGYADGRVISVREPLLEELKARFEE